MTESNIEEIGNLTHIVTLAKLAAEGKFVSIGHSLPVDLHQTEWLFTCDGKEYPVVDLVEVYAPGDNTGWAVIYVKKHIGIPLGKTEVVRGNWTIERKPPIRPEDNLSEASIG